MSRVILFFACLVLSFPVGAKICPDGSYVSGDECKLCPDGTYSGEQLRPLLAVSSHSPGDTLGGW